LNETGTKDPELIQRARIVLVLFLSKKSKGELVELIMSWLQALLLWGFSPFPEPNFPLTATAHPLRYRLRGFSFSLFGFLHSNLNDSENGHATVWRQKPGVLRC